MSTEIAKLETLTIYQAFIRAQKAFGPALKTSTNPHFRSRYADLSACVEAVIDALNTNGIGLMQTTHPCDNGVNVETILLHESGETISSGVLHVPASKQDAQGYGSALTYARRYSLMAICGIAPEDDDGNHAVRPAAVKPVAPASAKSDEELPDWLAPQISVAKIADDGNHAVSGKRTRVKTTYYNLEGCPGEQLKGAESYLIVSGAKRLNETRWKSSIKLEKLTQFIDEEFNE